MPMFLMPTRRAVAAECGAQTCSRSRTQSADVQSQSNAERRQAVAVVRTHGRGCSRSRTRADDKQSTVPRMRDTVRAVPQISCPCSQSSLARATAVRAVQRLFMPTQSNARTDRQARPMHAPLSCLSDSTIRYEKRDRYPARYMRAHACLPIGNPVSLPMGTSHENPCASHAQAV